MKEEERKRSRKEEERGGKSRKEDCLLRVEPLVGGRAQALQRVNHVAKDWQELRWGFDYNFTSYNFKEIP